MEFEIVASKWSFKYGVKYGVKGIWRRRNDNAGDGI